MRRALFAVLVFLTLSGCQKEAKWKSRTYAQRTSSSVAGVVPIPASLWKRLIEPERPLESLLGSALEARRKEPSKDSAVVETKVETDLKPVTVYLIEQTRGVLGGRNHKIQFGPGGGDLDLRDFVAEARGAMRVVFEFEAGSDPKAPRRVWYLSNARRRKVGLDYVGAGCRVYMDVSNLVAKSYADDGLLVALGGDRHVSALAGTFYFSLKNGSRVDVSRITIYDSSKRNLLCQSESTDGAIDESSN